MDDTAVARLKREFAEDQQMATMQMQPSASIFQSIASQKNLPSEFDDQQPPPSKISN
jgi:hypothetical protein